MKKLILSLAVVLILLTGCNKKHIESQDGIKWGYYQGPSGTCYEVGYWREGYAGYSMSSEVNGTFCEAFKQLDKEKEIKIRLL